MPRHERRLIEQPVARLDDDTTAIGDLLPYEIVHNFRILRNWSQANAAEWWGVHVRTWRRYESPLGTVPPPLMKRIAEWGKRSCPEYVRYLSS